MTLGSLFDGIGGFPLAGAMCGIIPAWSSEIEPFPLKVTAARFPDMKQLGSVTDINGAEVEPVDIITFGSPCQDLSVAGKRLGIHDGQRSNLFFEAVRIIKEMREADERTGRTDVDIRPRFAVWENVPGAFSNNKGADFQAVLQALASVRENGVSIPQPKKWWGAGCVMGNGWSIAWRVYDAQYWGVPQRRKRIYLVADFASERAGEILFERESVRGNPSEGGEAREGTAADVEGGVGGSSLFEPMSLMEENWSERVIKNALRENASKSSCCIVQRNNNGFFSKQRIGQYRYDHLSSTLAARDYKSASDVVVERKQKKYIIRRLTPTECARLQGFPDEWCEGLGGSDSAIYKAYGNGLALPCAYDVLRRIAKEYENAALQA